MILGFTSSDELRRELKRLRRIEKAAKHTLSTFKNYNRLHEASPGLDRMQDTMTQLEAALSGGE